jgi:hypothetical protein
MTTDLSQAEVGALVKDRLGVSSRTLGRYIAEGLIAKPVGPSYPAVLVTRQVVALTEARQQTKSMVGLRHWLWWDGDLIAWNRWRVDRMLEMSELARTVEHLRAMSEAERFDAAAEVAKKLGTLRDFPHRRHYLRTGPVRDRHLASMAISTGRANSPPMPRTGNQLTERSGRGYEVGSSCLIGDPHHHARMARATRLPLGGRPL